MLTAVIAQVTKSSCTPTGSIRFRSPIRHDYALGNSRRYLANRYGDRAGPQPAARTSSPYRPGRDRVFGALS